MSLIPDFILTSAPATAIVLLAVGLVGYAVALGIAAFGSATRWTKGLSDWISAWIGKSPACNLGIPCAALASFAIVSALLRHFTSSTSNGQLVLKAFSLEFSGPAGPVTLWLLCFLGFVIAIKLLSEGAPTNPGDPTKPAGSKQ